jgi:hypothetical protein
VREGKLSCDVLRAADLKTASIWKSEWDLGQGLSDKKGESEGKLANWIKMLVHPESAMRGKGNVDGNTDERADTGAGRDTHRLTQDIGAEKRKGSRKSDRSIRRISWMGGKRDDDLLTVRLRVCDGVFIVRL